MTTQQDDLFSALFEHRDQRIDQLGNPLVELDANVDWEAFRPLLDRKRPLNDAIEFSYKAVRVWLGRWIGETPG